MRYMVNLIYCLIMMLTIVQIAHGFDPLVNTKRALLFFIDDSEYYKERNKRGVFYQLMIAINQKAGPIVVSRSLLALIASEYALWQKAENVTPLFKQTVANFYNSHDWHIKEINPFLYLMMPTKYLNQFNISSENFREYSNAKELTKYERILGLKINHMRNKRLEDVNLMSVRYDYFTSAMYNNASKKSELFCLNNEYTVHGTIKSPKWSFYMLGHGIIQGKIVGLPIAVFRNFLDVIGSKITTELLVYQSCFATGYNAFAVYIDFQTNMPKIYPYAILVGAINDSVSFGIFAGTHIEDVFQLNPKLTIDYQKFFTQVMANDVINYNDVAENFFRDLEFPEVLPNVPQIKLLGLEWFSILDAKKFFYIGNNLARSRTEPLKINAKNNPKIILIYPPYIPFEIIINTSELQAVISMFPGNATHFIKKIKSNVSLDYIIKIFTRSKPGFKKGFLIEEVEIDSPSESEKIKIQNLFMDYNPIQEKWQIIYTSGKSLYAYHNEMRIALAQTSAGLDFNAFKQHFKNIQSAMENSFIQSPLVGFNFLEVLKKYQEQQITFDRLIDFQNQLLLLQSLQK